MDKRELIEECMERIRLKYFRRGKEELWEDGTRKEFLRAFAMVPLSHLKSIVDEMLFNPPTDDKGREINWLPDPSDIVRIAKRLTADAQTTPSAIVQEITDNIRRYGIYGHQHPERPNVYLVGQPTLSHLAQQVVDAMGGWVNLCQMESPDGVTNGLLLKHANDAVERRERMPLIAGKSMQSIGQTLQKMLPEGK
jgi:hypothetical protein